MFFKKRNIKSEGGIRNFRASFVKETALSDVAYESLIAPVEANITYLGIDERLACAVREFCALDRVSEMGRKQGAVLLVYLFVSEQLARADDEEHKYCPSAHYELNRVSLFLHFLNVSGPGCEWLSESSFIDDAWRFLRGSASIFSRVALSNETPNADVGIDENALNEKFVHVQNEDEPISNAEKSAIEGLLDDSDAQDPMSLIQTGCVEDEPEVEPQVFSERVNSENSDEDNADESDTDDDTGVSALNSLLNRS